MKPYHFYVAFNPLFNEDQTWKTQAHEFYYRLKEKKTSDVLSHMYWGKIQISQYTEPLNLAHFQRVVDENREMQMDTHLYVTDYQHLWVGKVEEVLQDIPDKENTLSFYKDKKVEIWFKISDFNLISHSAHQTLKLLSEIHVDNEYYDFKLKEMTPFASAIRFPMIIQDRSKERYFGQAGETPLVLAENPLLASQGEGLKLNHYIKSFVIPEENFKLLPEIVRSQLTHAEILLVEAQGVSGKKDRLKLEQAILTYLRCLEVLLNETFVVHLRQEEGYRIWVTKDAPYAKFIRSALDKDKRSLIRLKDSKDYFNLSQIKMLLDTPSFFPHTTLDYIFQKRKSFWEYCRLELRSTLKNESLIDLRAHLLNQTAQKIHDRELLLVRNILLGVGGKGVFNQIIESWYKIDAQNKKAA